MFSNFKQFSIHPQTLSHIHTLHPISNHQGYKSVVTKLITLDGEMKYFSFLFIKYTTASEYSVNEEL
jgi:hypothetical protein